MRPPVSTRLALAAVLTCLALAGCGGGSTTTIIKTTVGPSTSTSTTTSTSSSTTSTTTPTATSTVGAAGHEPSLASALQTVRSRGFNPTDTSAYDETASLAAIIGVRKGSGDGTAQRAFFFADGRFIGTDTSTDSSGIRIAFARPPVIALTYALYAAKDPQCCPTDGSATVRYQWSGSRLEPLDPIPPSSFSVGGSRR